MPFIIIDGLDGAGSSTQTELLKEYFAKSKIPSVFVRSPDYDHPIGQLISDYLHEKFELSNDQAFLVFAIDALNSVPKIRDGLKDGKIVVADRYMTSTIAYHCSRGFSFEDAMKLAELLKYPEADLIIFIDVKPETGMNRKIEQRKKLDKYEGDLEFLKRVREFYLREIKESVLGKWIVIDGGKSKSIEEVHEKIVSVLKENKFIK